MERLFALTARGVKLGLDRVRRGFEQAGHPERDLPVVHVAGSNGKGSTAAFIASILSSATEVALFTSPHLKCLTERMRFVDRYDSQIISREDLLAAVDAVEAAIPDFGDLTFFEIVTVSGFVAMKHRGVQLGVVECGLGARLDATRLADAHVSVLTDLSIEHSRILGDSIEKIAGEKLHVIRPGRPLVCTETASPFAEAAAAEAGSPLFLAGRDIHLREQAPGGWTFVLTDRVVEGVHPGLSGAHQAKNALLAAQAAVLMNPAIKNDEIRTGLQKVVWPGRMERIEGDPPLIFDGAHNGAAAEALAIALKDRPNGPLHFVFGALADKDARRMIAALRPLADRMILTEPPSHRSATVAHLAALAPDAETIADPQEAFAVAKAGARAASATVVVCGSIYLVGALRS